MSEDTVKALEVTGLSHRFKNHQALHRVDFTVERGSIHGFVGPNGAGKTTTLKLIATLLVPQTGSVLVLGDDVRRHVRKVRREIGYMPDHFAMYRQMKVYEYLDFFAAAYGQSFDRRTQTIDDVLQLTDMEGRKNDLIKGLSRGMQQRVSLARTLVHDPELLLLDEPASGLDPRARIELMEILRELRDMGKTIFISSHILSELATLCDAVTIIDVGSIKYTGSMAELLAHQGDHGEYVLQLAEDDEGLPDALGAVEGIEAVEPRAGRAEYAVRFHPSQADTRTILRFLLDRGCEVVSFRRSQRQLDEAFLDLTEPGVRS